MVLLVGVGAASSCGVNPTVATQAQTACSSAQAEILVGDGFTERLCGCAEGTSGVIARDAATVCTVPKGTSLYFIYQNYQPHQIVPKVGSPNVFTPMMPSDPRHGDHPTVVFVIPTMSVGTYQFVDQYDTISGTINVF
ncbi:MAG: hypothetical protein ACXVBW_09700 [Bdellovibrionota bacterium]